MFHSRTESEVMWGGAAGGGKTTVLIADILPRVKLDHDRCLLPREHPHHLQWGASKGSALHLRRTFPMLAKNIKNANLLYRAVDPGYEYNQQDHLGRFSSGYQIRFGHCQHAGDYHQYIGDEFDWVGFDELVQFNQEQYEQISARVRSSDPLLRQMLKVRATSNPFTRNEEGESIVVVDPTWVRRMFVEPCPEGNKVLVRWVTRRDGTKAKLTRLFMPATLYDNPDPEFVSLYELTLLGRPTHIQQAYLHGNWFITVGSFYGEAWNDRLHVVKPFKIPRDWKQWRSMDWGYKTTGVVLWWAMDEDENIYCTREYTFKEKTDLEVAARIKEIETAAGLWSAKAGSKLTGPADTQLWEERGDTSMSKAEAMQSVGVHWVRADKKSRQHNSEKFMSRLLDHRHNTTLPGIMFFSDCGQCIQTIPGIQGDPNDLETPMKGGQDHHHDAVVYSCAYASRGAAGIPMFGKPGSGSNDNSMDDDDDDEDKSDGAESRGQWGYG